jgi:hypothetical protein
VAVVSSEEIDAAGLESYHGEGGGEAMRRTDRDAARGKDPARGMDGDAARGSSGDVARGAAGGTVSADAAGTVAIEGSVGANDAARGAGRSVTRGER